MSAEPLYCRVCGAEDYGCEHTFTENEDAHAPGAFCEVCGVVHTPDDPCWFFDRPPAGDAA